MLTKVAKLFNENSNIEHLSGGQNESVKVGRISIKPIHEIEKYIWISKLMGKLISKKILMSRPVKSKNGKWIEHGYGATEYIDGNFYEGRIEEKLKACNYLNDLLKNVKYPEQSYTWSSPWISASKVSWESEKIPTNSIKIAKELISSLQSKLQRIHLASQVIHTDLAGNILFNDAGTPVIIDFSPDYKPAIYAQVLLIIDSVAWHNENLSIIDQISCDETLKNQLILRAIIFRLCVPLYFDPTNENIFLETYNEFSEILRYTNLT